MVKIAVLLSFSILTSGCAQESWEGYLYPDRTDLSEHEMIGVFPSLEDCRAATRSEMRRLTNPDRATYECSLNCEFQEGWGNLRICEKTSK